MVETGSGSAAAAEAIVSARRLLDCVTYDVCGKDGTGGNGGLTSTETIQAADRLRVALWRYERERARW